MNFTSVENKDYLVYSDLKDGQDINHICFVSNVSSSVSAIGEPYYRLHLRTADMVNMTCVIFSTKDFDKLGFRLNMLKNKYIRLQAYVKEVDKRMLLQFEKLELIEEGIDEIRPKFQKKVDDVEGLYADVNSAFSSIGDYSLPPITKIKCYPTLSNGFSGGFVKYAFEMLIHTRAIVVSMPDDYETVMKVLFKTLVAYHSYLDKTLSINIFTDSDKIEFISKLPNTNYEDRLIIESVSALIGLTKPNHLIPTILFMCSELIMKTQHIADEWRTLRPGGMVHCEGIDLLKY